MSSSHSILLQKCFNNAPVFCLSDSLIWHFVHQNPVCCIQPKTQIKYMRFYYLAENIWVSQAQVWCGSSVNTRDSFQFLPLYLQVVAFTDIVQRGCWSTSQGFLSPDSKDKRGRGRDIPSLKDISRTFYCHFSSHPVGQNLVVTAHQIAVETRNVVFILCSHSVN